jgi:hypothetical protein
MVGTIPINEYIGKVQLEQGFDTAKYKTLIRQSIFYALNEAKFHVMNTQVQVFPVDDSLCIDIPEDYVATKKITFKNKDGACVQPFYDASFICCQNNNGHDDCCPDFTVQEHKEKIQYSSNVLECFDCVVVEYYGYCVDDEGAPVVPIMALPYLDAYIDWAILKKIRRENRSKSASRNNPVNQSEVTEAREYYKRELKALYASIVTPTFQQLQQASELFLCTPNTFPPAITGCFRSFFDRKGKGYTQKKKSTPYR